MPTSARRRVAPPRAPREGQRVGRVGVAAAGGVEDLAPWWRPRPGLAFHDVAVALEERGERGVDVVVLQGPDEQGRHEAAVLAHAVDHVVAGPGQQDVLVDAGDLVGLAGAGEEVLVGLRLPGAEAGAGAGARGAALLAVDAVVGAQLVLEVERLVGAGLVGVADDVVRARDDAAGAAGAQARLDDLGVELLPLRRPARGLGGGRGGVGHGHAPKVVGTRPEHPTDRRDPTTRAGVGSLPRAWRRRGTPPPPGAADPPRRRTGEPPTRPPPRDRRRLTARATRSTPSTRTARRVRTTHDDRGGPGGSASCSAAARCCRR